MTSTNSSVAACVALLKAIAPATYESLASTPFAVDDDDHSHSHGGDDDHGHDHGHGDDDHGHDHDHDHDHSHGGHGHSHGFCEGLEGLYSVGLHVGAIFVVLVASAVGAMLPILGKRVRALRIPPYVYSVGKCTATGVMLSVAMIHMINHASLAFAAECVPESFAERFEGWAFLFAMIAAILMHAVDVAVADIAEGWAFRRSECAAAAAAEGNEPSGNVLVCCGEGDDHHHHLVDPVVGATGADSNAEDNGSCDHEKCGTVCLEEPADGAVAVPISSKEGDCCDSPACVGHQHGVAVPEDMGAVQRVVAAACMEFGVTLHSVFVGLALGVTSDSDLKVLLVALVFHQLFEGLAMGARLAEAGFHLSLEIVLMVVFALSAPIGISAGTIAVSVSRTALAGTTYVMVSAVLDSVCGGILLYLAFNLLFVDFPADMRAHCGRDAPHRVWRKLGLLAGLWLGAGVLAFIGKWL